LFIATSKNKNLVVYDELCKKLTLTYIDKSVKFHSLSINNKNNLLFVTTNKGSI